MSDLKWIKLLLSTLPLGRLGSVQLYIYTLYCKDVSFAHQGCIHLIQ